MIKAGKFRISDKPYAPSAGGCLACEVHGPLKLRRETYGSSEPELVWVCVGFDGEASGWCTARVPDTARERLASGETYWPGVTVRDADGQVTGLRPEEGAEAAKARELVNRILRAGPSLDSSQDGH